MITMALVCLLMDVDLKQDDNYVMRRMLQRRWRKGRGGGAADRKEKNKEEEEREETNDNDGNGVLMDAVL